MATTDDPIEMLEAWLEQLNRQLQLTAILVEMAQAQIVRPER